MKESFAFEDEVIEVPIAYLQSARRTVFNHKTKIDELLNERRRLKYQNARLQAKLEALLEEKEEPAA